MCEVSSDDFYRGKTIQTTEWWISDCDLPRLVWARLRIFDDGTADACWEEGGKLYGFDSATFASNFLAEDEYVRFDGLGDEDSIEHGCELADATVPSWTDIATEFEYLGSY